MDKLTAADILKATQQLREARKVSCDSCYKAEGFNIILIDGIQRLYCGECMKKLWCDDTYK